MRRYFYAFLGRPLRAVGLLVGDEKAPDYAEQFLMIGIGSLNANSVFLFPFDIGFTDEFVPFSYRLNLLQLLNNNF